MNLFDSEVAKYSRGFISGMNTIEANRASIDLLGEISENIHLSGFAHHVHFCIHDYSLPAQLSLGLHIYRSAEDLKRLAEKLSAVAGANQGELVVAPDTEHRSNVYYLNIPNHHRFEISFADEEITREMLIEALEVKVAA